MFQNDSFFGCGVLVFCGFDFMCTSANRILKKKLKKLVTLNTKFIQRKIHVHSKETVLSTPPPGGV